MPESTRGRLGGGTGAASDMSGILSAPETLAPTGLVSRARSSPALAPFGTLRLGVGAVQALDRRGPDTGVRVRALGLAGRVGLAGLAGLAGRCWYGGHPDPAHAAAPAFPGHEPGGPRG